MSKGFESVSRIVSRVTRHRSRAIKFCRCGHPKSSHERHPAIVDLGLPSGEDCLLCDCQAYRFGRKAVA